MLYLRMFKDVPASTWRCTYATKTKVRMRLIDKAPIASPIVMGIPTLAMKNLRSRWDQVLARSSS